MKDGKSVWVRAGSAWENRDGSMNVYLDVLPLDGMLHLREPYRDADASTKDGKGADPNEPPVSPSPPLDRG